MAILPCSVVIQETTESDQGGFHRECSVDAVSAGAFVLALMENADRSAKNSLPQGASQ